MPTNVRFKKVVEFENAGKRYRKATSAEAKKFQGAVRDTYETAPGVPSYGWFVPVDAKPVQPTEPAK